MQQHGSQIGLSISPLCLGVTWCTIGLSLWYFMRHHRPQKRERSLMIMSRYPVVGTTKTRLIPSIGDRGAYLMQLHMTENLLDKISQVDRRNSGVDIEFVYAGGTESKIAYWLGKRKKCTELSWRPQVSGGLGEKLTAVFSGTFEEGAKYAVAIGSDIPGINSGIIDEAFDLLSSGKHIVLGKAEDGGYYLVGISNLLARQLGDIFKDIDWGTEKVFEQQMKRAHELGVKAGVLKTILSDVDTSDDIPVFEKALGLTVSQLLYPTLSIVIPVYNEVENIIKTLETVAQNAKFKERLEIIISDGGSTDGTQSAILQFSKRTNFTVSLITSPPGRGPQLIHGSRAAKGDNLLFLHAESIVPRNFDEQIQHCLEVPGNAAGAFKFDLDIFHSDICSQKVSLLFYVKMKIIALSTNIRASKIELPYGDQGLFMRRQTYDKVGGFDEVYLMEDYIMVKKLQKIGHIDIAPGDSLITSARRWINHGAVKTSVLNWLIVLVYRCGVAPNTLAKWYYGDKLKKILKKDD